MILKKSPSSPRQGFSLLFREQLTPMIASGI